MTITKVAKLKGFGIFQDFAWGTGLPDFKRFNLIYGWNRSGKTTFSRVFSACERKSIGFKRYPLNAEFEVKTADNNTVKSSEITNCGLTVKCFNQDFIEENISFEIGESCSPIVHIGVEDIENQKKLQQLKQAKDALQKQLDDAQKNYDVADEKRNSFLTGLGREVSNALFDKTYNRTKIEGRIRTLGVPKILSQVLDDSEKSTCEEVLRSQAKAKQDLIPSVALKITICGEEVSSFEVVNTKIGSILAKTVTSESLERLKQDPELNSWVKDGFDLHRSKEETHKCLFCTQALSQGFWETLSNHFSEEYQKLQESITEIIGELNNASQAEIQNIEAELYPALKEGYRNKRKQLNEVIKKHNEWVNGTISRLNSKYKNPLGLIEGQVYPEDLFVAHNQATKELNEILSSHNAKVDNHLGEVKTAKEKVEFHLMAVAFKAQDYDDLLKELTVAGESLASAKKASRENEEAIVVLEQKLSQIGKAIGEVNRHLVEFFGRKEIELALDADQKGYVIKRDGNVASNLSEGEKTAIAFAYFIVKTRERDNKISETIIFIDDPISSFDSNFVFHCCSLIKVHFQDASQLFISTHNFHFFNLVKDWFLRKNSQVERKNKGKKDSEKCAIPCDFFMVENSTESAIRKASIAVLDETLKRFKSEYHFLFDRLLRFSQDNAPDYADLYTIANIARRFLEIFTNFKIPTTGDLASKIEQLDIDEAKVSKVDREKVYRLVQEYSHADPASGIEHINKQACKDAVNIIMKIIEESDPKHYSLLQEAL